MSHFRTLLLCGCGLVMASEALAMGGIGIGHKSKSRNANGVQAIHAYICTSLDCSQSDVTLVEDCDEDGHFKKEFGICRCDTGYTQITQNNKVVCVACASGDSCDCGTGYKWDGTKCAIDCDYGEPSADGKTCTCYGRRTGDNCNIPPTECPDLSAIPNAIEVETIITDSGETKCVIHSEYSELVTCDVKDGMMCSTQDCICYDTKTQTARCQWYCGRCDKPQKVSFVNGVPYCASYANECYDSECCAAFPDTTFDIGFRYNEGRCCPASDGIASCPYESYSVFDCVCASTPEECYDQSCCENPAINGEWYEFDISTPSCCSKAKVRNIETHKYCETFDWVTERHLECDETGNNCSCEDGREWSAAQMDCVWDTTTQKGCIGKDPTNRWINNSCFTISYYLEGEMHLENYYTGNDKKDFIERNKMADCSITSPSSETTPYYTCTCKPYHHLEHLEDDAVCIADS